MMRRWLILLAVFSFAAWGPLDALPCLASLRLPPAAPTSHTAACLCQNCLHGTQCCCHLAQNASQAAVLKAACDNPLSASLVSKVKTPVILFVAPVTVILSNSQPVIAAPTATLRTNPLVPQSPPPRLR